MSDERERLIEHALGEFFRRRGREADEAAARVRAAWEAGERREPLEEAVRREAERAAAAAGGAPASGAADAGSADAGAPGMGDPSDADSSVADPRLGDPRLGDPRFGGADVDGIAARGPQTERDIEAGALSERSPELARPGTDDESVHRPSAPRLLRPWWFVAAAAVLLLTLLEPREPRSGSAADETVAVGSSPGDAAGVSESPSGTERDHPPPTGGGPAPLFALSERPLEPLEPARDPARAVVEPGTWYVPGTTPVELVCANGRLRAAPGSLLEFTASGSRAGMLALLVGEAAWTEAPEPPLDPSGRRGPSVGAPMREVALVAGGGTLAAGPGTRLRLDCLAVREDDAPTRAFADRADALAWLVDYRSSERDGTPLARPRLAADLRVESGSAELWIADRREHFIEGCRRSFVDGPLVAHTTDDPRRLGILFDQLEYDLARAIPIGWKTYSEMRREKWFQRDELANLLSQDARRWTLLREPLLRHLSLKGPETIASRVMLDLLVHDASDEARALVDELWQRAPEAFSEDQLVWLAEAEQPVFEDELRAVVDLGYIDEPWARVLPAAFWALRGDDVGHDALTERFEAELEGLAMLAPTAWVAAIGLEALGEPGRVEELRARTKDYVRETIALGMLEVAADLVRRADFFIEVAASARDSREQGGPPPSLAYLVERLTDFAAEDDRSLKSSDDILAAVEEMLKR